MPTENVAAQQLVAQGDALRSYSDDSRTNADNRMEINLIITRSYETTGEKAHTSLIEVKSGKRYAFSSLDKLKMKFGKRIGMQFVLHPKLLQKDDDRPFLPLYMARLL